ncbi:MAG: peptidylprolyl isomerase [Litorimonas sp.]
MDKGLKLGTYISISGIFASFLLTACDKSHNTVPTTPQSGVILPALDAAVAKVDGEEILYSDVRRTAIEQGWLEPKISDSSVNDSQGIAPIDVSIFNRALDSLIDQKLLAQDAQRKALHKTPEASMRLAAGRERILSSISLETYIRKTVTEEKMRKLYDTQAALADFGDEIRARHIVVESEDAALKLIKALGEGDDFSALAADMSLDIDTRDRGGDLGYFTSDMLVPDFVRPIFKGQKGATLPPFETNKGWHVVEILDRRRPDVKSYEDSEEALRNFLTFDAIEEFIAELRKKGTVKLIPIGSTHHPDK